MITSCNVSDVVDSGDPFSDEDSSSPSSPERQQESEEDQEEEQEQKKEVQYFVRSRENQQSDVTSRAVAGCVHRSFLLTDTHLHVTKVWPRSWDHQLAGLVMEHTFVPQVPHLLSMDLCGGAKRMLETPNAGGSSLWSEVMSFEILHLLFHVELLHTEMELEYVPCSKITDYSVRLYQHILGVSVTRAQKYRGTFGLEDARRLLERKLFGVVCSTRNVINTEWKRQFLHVFVEKPRYLLPLKQAYQEMPRDLRDNTICLFTVIPTHPPFPVGWLFWEKPHYTLPDPSVNSSVLPSCVPKKLLRKLRRQLALSSPSPPGSGEPLPVSPLPKKSPSSSCCDDD